MKLEFENVLHPAHKMNDPAKLTANIKWFQTQWDLMARLGSDLLLTDVCGYVRTKTGFRRLITQSDHDDVIAARQAGGTYLDHQKGI